MRRICCVGLVLGALLLGSAYRSAPTGEIARAESADPAMVVQRYRDAVNRGDTV